ncbi:NnrS family protein [Advenella sp. S44]|uniref:NnrS family protein n=1 Tax=Advenella sp. S44 TaxID=1982755 RepID=UPI000C2A90CB|nr:NnrS family protein [Advenella sp. S44]PJX22059.1 NnrS family protein [Advenella sp. S44]
MHASIPVQPRFSSAAFLSLGFRPLYIAGAAWALISVAIWIFMPHLLRGQLGGVWWHAHEMLWGFVATIAVGFLTTASATWTGINPIRGRALGMLTLCWLVARLAFLVPGQPAFIVAMVCDTLFYLAAAVALWRVIFKARNKRNYILPVMMLALGLSDFLYLLAVSQGRVVLLTGFMQIGILCMVFIALLIARRVIPFFATRAIADLEMPAHERSGLLQLVACGVAILGVVVQVDYLLAAGAATAGATALYQLVQWKPLRVVRVPLLWVLYLAWFFMGAGLLLAACYFLGWRPTFLARQAVYVHVIAMGGFSIMIIGMITRTALGHTGRALKADRLMVCSYLLIFIATLVRLAALMLPALSMPMLHLAALAWIIAFALYLYRFVPFLVSPRPQQGNMPPMAIRPDQKKS